MNGAISSVLACQQLGFTPYDGNRGDDGKQREEKVSKTECFKRVNMKLLSI